jgi:hypothetical protein
MEAQTSRVLWIADRGYSDHKLFAEIADDHGYSLVRLKTSSLPTLARIRSGVAKAHLDEPLTPELPVLGVVDVDARFEVGRTRPPRHQSALTLTRKSTNRNGRMRIDEARRAPDVIARNVDETIEPDPRRARRDTGAGVYGRWSDLRADAAKQQGRSPMHMRGSQAAAERAPARSPMSPCSSLG